LKNAETPGKHGFQGIAVIAILSSGSSGHRFESSQPDYVVVALHSRCNGVAKCKDRRHELGILAQTPQTVTTNQNVPFGFAWTAFSTPDSQPRIGIR
jgi:hypothetical protein